MSEFRDVDIRRLDGGLLLVFREVLHRRNAKEAGVRLGLSQPAISHALTRLRDLFGDPLFIRRPHGLEPTRRALELAPRIEALIDLAGAAISRGAVFDPSLTQRRFTLAGQDSVTSLFTPALFAAFRKEAPGAVLQTLEMMHWPAVDALRRGEIDVGIGRFGRLPPGLIGETLYEDEYCVVARNGHPRIRSRLSPKAFREIGHVFVSPPVREDGAAWNPSESASIYGTIPDRVVALGYVPRFHMAMTMVAASDAIADIPRRLAERFAPMLGLQILTHPYHPAGIVIQAVRRTDARDPAIDWLWRQVRAAAP